MKSGVSVKVKEIFIEHVTPSLEGVDEEDIGQYIEETFFKESLEAVLLNNDEKGSE
ncbi:hypothetical protein HAX54_040120, partial [Datura stramonium]|nr:hypothetical protein [Datura stramonium]